LVRVTGCAPTEQRAPAQEKAPAETLEERTRGVIRRLARKERAVQMLLAGQLTVLEAAAHYRLLDNGPPLFYWDKWREVTPGHSDDERYCWEVIRYVRAVVHRRDRPEGEETVERLCSE
jgi:hypothetical protein